MEKKTEQIHPDQWLKDLPDLKEIQSFEAEELIECDSCGRKSPPTRLKCMYCGGNLQISNEQLKHLKPALRKLEEWEKGFNLIVNAQKYLPEKNIEEIAALVKLDTNDVEKIIDAEQKLPLARAETLIEAEFLLKKLTGLGLECEIISDVALNAEKLPQRLRGLEFDDDKLILILFNTSEIVQIPRADLKNVVVGAMFEHKHESQESLKKTAKKKMLDFSEVSSDEILIDIYSQTDSVGYRIEPKGFDFAALEGEKSLLAKDNMTKLVEKLRQFSPYLVINRNYVHLREELGKIWSVSERSDSGGFQRNGLVNFKRTNITTVNNLSQFTRFSRMQWHLI